MNKEELIGKLQMVYVGDKNALNELIGYYDGLKQGIEELQQENKQLKEKINKYKKIVEEINQEIEWVKDLVDTCELVDTNAITIYKIIQKYEKSDSNEVV